MDRELCSRRGGGGEESAFPAGVAIASCALSDEAGAVGVASQASTIRVETAAAAGAVRLRRIRAFMASPCLR
ncbi:hypothetical protein A7X61_04945 [Stenotrophomonas maltophilia]|nr:hypothetical protein A7X61_04945 [Stenotrophomonas maltophilia]PZS92190.1 hypothetical protein A7X66_16095 [Stenotrophomonas maltophilia]